MDNTVLIAIIGGVGMLITGGLASIPGILALRQQKRKLNAESQKLASEAEKTEADAAQVIQDMTLKLITPYQNRIAELEQMVRKDNAELTDRVERLETELMEVAECAYALYNQIKASGGTPECEPPDETKLAEKFGKAITRKRG